MCEFKDIPPIREISLYYGVCVCGGHVSQQIAGEASCTQCYYPQLEDESRFTVTTKNGKRCIASNNENKIKK